MVSEGGGCRGKGLMADAKAERRFPYKLFPTRDSDMTMSRDKPVELLACRRVPTSLPRVLFLTRFLSHFSSGHLSR